MEEQQKKRQENVVAGLVGAFLGALLGVVCTVVIGQLGYVASVSGLIMAVGALKGYELLGGRLSKKGAVISSVLILVMTWLAHRLTWAIALASAAGLGVFESFQTIPELLEAGLLEGPAYWGDLVMLYLFTLLGAVPTIIGGLRSADLPDLPQAAASAQGGELPGLTLYPGSVAWMRPLRLSAAGAMFVGLIPGIALLLAGFANGAPLTFTLAAMGCIVASFVMMFFALPSIQLCYRSMNLMVRSGSTVWRVTLPMLNNADTYRFTKRTGAFRAIRWEILTEQERDQLKMSVQRAIALLSSGQVMPGSALSAAVMPLPNLRIYKETRWLWKGTYSGRDGKEKKVAIPKAYEGFAPAQELEAAQQPVPPHWGLLAAAAALTAALALAGAGLGWTLDGGGRNNPGAGDPLPSPTATIPPESSVPVQPDPQGLFHVGEELGYEFTAVGYIKAPDGMFAQDGSYVDAHVPYSEEPVYLEDGHAIRSAAHGMEVTVKIAQTDGDARDVVDQAYELMAESGTDFYEDGVQDTYYFDEYDIAVKQVSYFEENRTKVRVAVLYADYKQDGYYLSAAIIYQPELMDGDYPALLAELGDAYALNLPEIPPMDEA